MQSYLLTISGIFSEESATLLVAACPPAQTEGRRVQNKQGCNGYNMNSLHEWAPDNGSIYNATGGNSAVACISEEIARKTMVPVGLVEG